MSEDYNSPQSVYWCLKPFIVAGLPESHPFWTSDEKSYPADRSAPHLGNLTLLEQPRHILCNTPEHHFLLSTGQGTRRNHKAKEAKYGKLAYSSAFAFSVPVAGHVLEHIAPDSTIAVSWDEGESWRVHEDPDGLATGSAELGAETVPTLSGTWRPSRFLGVEVRTTLIPPAARLPGWHLRVHQIRIRPGGIKPFKRLYFVDSGFSTSAETAEGSSIYEIPCGEGDEVLDAHVKRGAEGWWKTNSAALVSSRTGASGLIDLSQRFLDQSPAVRTNGDIIKPHANTNLMVQRSLIPSVRHTIDLREVSDSASGEPLVVTFVTGVFAVEGSTPASRADLYKMWKSLPEGQLSSLGIRN